MKEPRKIIFVEKYLPPLEAGEYEITVTQTVKATASANAPDDCLFKDTFTNVRRLYVRGERFVLEPGEVVSVFPPAGSTGEYQYVLPHIIFERRTLPWERSLGKNAPGVPWLALLLFRQAEAPRVQKLQVFDLMRGGAGRLPSSTISYADAHAEIDPKADSPFGPELGEMASDPCQVIDIEAGLFRQIAPTLEDLRWLAHVRSVPASAKPGLQDIAIVDRSIIVGNCLPAPGESCVCHLVSLEGFEPYLPGPNCKLPNNVLVRLVSLKSWTFSPDPARQTFSKYLENVSCRSLRRLFQGGNETDVEATVLNAFEFGYSALNHQTRLGDKTVSWYHGPFLPAKVSNGTEVPPPRTGVVIHSADEAVRYDPTTGMMDVSYAAAWEIGRLLALASRSFSVSLAAWKAAAKLGTVHSVASQTIAKRFAALAAVAEDHPGELLAQGRSAEIVAAHLFANLAPRGTPDAASWANGKAHSEGGALLPRESHHGMITQLDVKALQEIHEETKVPPSIMQWLQDLVALKEVPFGYLVPDRTLLPPESIRFFILDRNWINALLEGATSIGRASSFDLKHDDALAIKLYEAACVPEKGSGFLLRSAVIEGWPGLEVTAFDKDGNLIGGKAASSRLLERASAGSTTVQVRPGDGERFPMTPFEATVTFRREAARCTAVTGNMLTLERAQKAEFLRDILPLDQIEIAAGDFLPLPIRTIQDSVRITVELKEGTQLPEAPFEVAIYFQPEIVRCTDVDGDCLTVVRAQQGTSARNLFEDDEVVLTNSRLRLERLGPSLLLFLTGGEVASVEIHEPGEGLHFGIPASAKALRRATPGAETGSPGGGRPGTQTSQTIDLWRHVSEARRLAIAQIAESIRDAGGAIVKNEKGQFTSAEFALQLIEGVESVCFELNEKTSTEEEK